MSTVRTRFAPSPTGFQHIGGFRSAVYAWLLAKHFDGDFVLRIEDTDQERKVEGAVRHIIEGLDWLGIDIDEGPAPEELTQIGEYWEGAPELKGEHGPYIQSQRLERYKEISDQLIEKGFAFRCDCTPEMLEQERAEQRARKEIPGYSGYCRTRNVSADTKHVVRFKMPHKPEVVMNDGVRGRVAWDSIPLRDPVLMKSDGFPTYHLAVVVDDHDMQITHVMRGEEWIPSAPLHILLYQALGWEPPTFCHLPVVKGPDGKKLSKRHGATSIEAFKHDGYLPQALLNFVVLIGWSPGEGDEQEIFTKEELVKKFSLDHVNEASGVFDYKKLDWMNGMYIRNLSDEEFTKHAEPYLTEKGWSVSDERWINIAPHVRERIKLFTEIPEMVEFLFVDEIERDLSKMLKKNVDAKLAQQMISAAEGKIENLEEFSSEALDGVMRPLAEELDLKIGALFGTLRIAVTGSPATPPLFESMVALGKESTLKRLQEAHKLLDNI